MRWAAVYVGDSNEPIAIFRYSDQAFSWVRLTYPGSDAKLVPYERLEDIDTDPDTDLLIPDSGNPVG